MVNADGLKAMDAAELVTKPLEALIKSVDEVEHVYSLTEDDRVTVTARFKVGTDKDRALLRIHDIVQANMNRLPIGIPEPLIIGRGVNDVPIVTLTLAAKPENRDGWNDNTLYDVADKLLGELIKVDDVGLTFITGGRPNRIRVEPDPERLSLYGVTLRQLIEKVKNANRAFIAGRLGDGGRTLATIAGRTLRGIPDIGLLLITARDGRPVYVKDVANVVVGAAPSESRVWNLEWETARDGGKELAKTPAVTIAIAKRKGANAVNVARDIIDRLDSLLGYSGAFRRRS